MVVSKKITYNLLLGTEALALVFLIFNSSLFVGEKIVISSLIIILGQTAYLRGRI